MFGAVFVVTIIMAVYIWHKMRKIKKVLLEEQAARRVARLKQEAGGSVGGEGEWEILAVNEAGKS
jgi:hypothetical protein